LPLAPTRGKLQPMTRALSPRTYHLVTACAVVALAVIIVSGAAVRLTGSGLGCTDWPTCEDSRFRPELDNVHGLVEFGNRLFTGVVSLAVIAAVLGSRRRHPRRGDLTWWSWGLVAGVLAQIIIGRFVVDLELVPGVVMLHFLVSMLLVWNALVLHHRAALPDAAPPPTRSLPTVLARARLATALAAVALVAGTVVTGAGPHAGDEGAERLDVDLIWAVRAHSTLVWLFVAAVLWLGWTLRRNAAPGDLWRPYRALVGAIVVQGTIGYVQYFTDVPALLVGFHVAGATLVWMAVVRLHLQVSNPTPLLLPHAAEAVPVPAVPSPSMST
jgi:cytochrome c oxidase assembly protein subunit 15